MKNIFASLGVLAALVGTAICGAMLCMGNASADAAAWKDKPDPFPRRYRQLRATSMTMCDGTEKA